MLDSSQLNQIMASPCVLPHISKLGFRDAHTAGRSDSPNKPHRLWSSSWTHRTPAGFPRSMPEIGLEIEGAMQQAPQPERQFTATSFCY